MFDVPTANALTDQVMIHCPSGHLVTCARLASGQHGESRAVKKLAEASERSGETQGIG